MKPDSLGLNQSLSRSATCQTVTPRSPALSSGQRKIAPPHSSSVTPRWSRYQAARAVRSVLDLKKTPPIPVTLAMLRSPIAERPIVAAPELTRSAAPPRFQNDLPRGKSSNRDSRTARRQSDAQVDDRE